MTIDLKTSNVPQAKGSNPLKETPEGTAALALTTAGGLEIDGNYDNYHIATVTGATDVTVKDGFLGEANFFVAGNAGGLTFKDEDGNSIGTIGAGVTGSYTLKFNRNATYGYSLSDYGA